MFVEGTLPIGRRGVDLHDRLQARDEGARRFEWRLRGGVGASVTLAGVTGAFVHRLRVRYSECDPQGVVFNANYVTYFDIALTELWRETIGPYAEMIAAGADMVVAEAWVRYRAPAGFDDVLEIAVVPTRLGNTGMTTEMEVRRGDVLVAEGQMRHVFVEAGSGAKRPIPDDVRRGLEVYAREDAYSEGLARGEGTSAAMADRGGGQGDGSQHDRHADGTPPAVPG